RTFGNAFIHPRNSARWGWKSDYVSILKSRLPRRKVPLFFLAVWFYREKGWKETVRRRDVTTAFIREYGLTNDELECLFDREVDSRLSDSEAFAPTPTRWQEIQAGYGRPPDVKPERGSALVFLETTG